MVREILQVIRQDQQYLNFFLFGENEGLSDLFSGLIPSLIANFVTVLTMFGIGFVINRLLLRCEVRFMGLETYKGI
jgi:hypothetical protein